MEPVTGIGTAITRWASHLGCPKITGTVEVFVESISSRTAIWLATVKVALLANQFPADYSGDPCDRLVGATALAEEMARVLVSPRQKLASAVLNAVRSSS